jgi:formylmethanofuran dehydrogenase subunit C
VFIGPVVAQGSPATLELASAASAGTITGIGTSFSGFSSITVDPDATWVAAGSVTGGGTVNLGADSKLTVGGEAQTGSITIAGDGTLIVGAATVTGDVSDAGVVEATGRLLQVSGAVAGTGALLIDA